MSLGNKQIMAENIKKLLDMKGLNPRQMALALDFKYTTVLDWVNAKTYPRIDKIEIMANYFGVNKSDLIEENKNVTTENLIDEKLEKYYNNIKDRRKEERVVFSDEAFKNAALAWKTAPYLEIDEYIFELILNWNINNLKQVNDKDTLIEYFEDGVKNLKLGQEDTRVPRDVRDYLGIIQKQYENYLSILKYNC